MFSIVRFYLLFVITEQIKYRKKNHIQQKQAQKKNAPKLQLTNMKCTRTTWFISNSIQLNLLYVL